MRFSVIFIICLCLAWTGAAAVTIHIKRCTPPTSISDIQERDIFVTVCEQAWKERVESSYPKTPADYVITVIMNAVVIYLMSIVAMIF